MKTRHEMRQHARKVQRYGALRDHPDPRDEVLTADDVEKATQAVFTLRHTLHMPPIWDQLNLGSCTAHGVGRCAAYARAKSENNTPETPSRLWIYFMERMLEGTIGSDSGAMPRDGFKVVSSMGFPPEALWPYNPAQFAVTPPTAVDTAALTDKVLKYRRLAVPTIAHIKNCLATNQTPITLGFIVYESFESMIGADGMMPMPQSNEQVLGGHCVAIVGWNDNDETLECANSWNTSWGDQGYFHMPYDFVTPDTCFDFWQATVAD